MLDLVSSLALAAAQPADAPIVVTASRTAEGPVGRASRAVDADEIARLQPGSLLEALDDVAGVRAFSTGGIGGGSFLSIRGGEPNFTMVLIDGVRLNNPTNSRGGAFDFFAIDPMQIERIEVARGAVSAVHGADALSGVVNIRLRAPVPGETGVTARASAGSEGDAGLGLAFNHGWRDGGLLVSAGWYDSGGLDLGSDLERRQALARIDQRVGGFEARALGLYAHADRSTFPEDSGGPLFAVNRERETGDYELRAGALSLRRSRDAAVRPGFTFSWSEQRDDSRHPGDRAGRARRRPGARRRRPLLARRGDRRDRLRRGPADRDPGRRLAARIRAQRRHHRFRLPAARRLRSGADHAQRLRRGRLAPEPNRRDQPGRPLRRRRRRPQRLDRPRRHLRPAEPRRARFLRAHRRGL